MIKNGDAYQQTKFTYEAKWITARVSCFQEVRLNIDLLCPPALQRRRWDHGGIGWIEFGTRPAA